MSRSNVGQHRAIAITLSEAGVATRPHRLEIVSRLAGRDLQSTKDLTKSEASSILEHLHQLKDIGELRMLIEQYAPEVTP